MKKLFVLLAAFLMLFLCNAAASKAVTLGFAPDFQEVSIGNQANVDLVISGLGDGIAPSLSTFDIDITYETTILDFTGYALGNYLGDISLVEAQDLSFGEFLPGVINIYELSLLYANQASDPFYDPLIPDSGFPPYLDNIQLSSFTLATLSFDTLALGNSPLDITVLSLGDAYGDPLTVDLYSGSINVVPVGFLRKKKKNQVS